ncbi:MAG: hypothetical protein ACFNLC_05360, partial [Prevotella denticola]
RTDRLAKRVQRYGENSFQPNVSRIIFQKNMFLLLLKKYKEIPPYIIYRPISAGHIDTSGRAAGYE